MPSRAERAKVFVLPSRRTVGRPPRNRCRAAATDHTERTFRPTAQCEHYDVIAPRRRTFAEASRNGRIDSYARSYPGQQGLGACVLRPKLCTETLRTSHRVGGMTRSPDDTVPQRSAADTAAWSTMRADRRFLWFWLSVATALSVAGNVGHAWLELPTEGSRWMVIGWASAPPALLMLAIHGLPTLARMLDRAARDKILSVVVWGVTVGAFGWSAFGIYGFTVAMGIPGEMAWVAPLVIDLSVFGATRGLVLTAPAAACMKAGMQPLRSEATFVPTTQHAHDGGHSANKPAATPRTAAGRVPMPSGAPAMAARPDSSARNEPSTGPAVTLSAEQSAPSKASMPQWASERSLTAVPSAGRIPVQIRPESVPTTDDDSTTKSRARADRWWPVAQSMVREGVTSKDPDLVAKILAESEAGTPPSTIGRRHEVHHTTVTRILTAAEQFADVSAG